MLDFFHFYMYLMTNGKKGGDVNVVMGDWITNCIYSSVLSMFGNNIRPCELYMPGSKSKSNNIQVNITLNVQTHLMSQFP
jgi:hypothetical protein